MKTVEQLYNESLKQCKYHVVKKIMDLVLWERECGNNDIDFVIGYKWKMFENKKQEEAVDSDIDTFSNMTPKPPEIIHFDIKRKDNIALRFVSRQEAEAFFTKSTTFTK